MTRPGRTLWLLGLLLLVVPACVKLTGQRITWTYDAAKDELRVLLFYDGIHDSGDNGKDKGTEQLPKFVRNGDVMLLDWPLHFDRVAIQAQADDPAKTQLQQDWARLWLSLRSEPVGHYRDPDGHIGAIQQLTIPAAKQFFVRLNGLINRQVLDNPGDETAQRLRTWQAMRTAAKAGHTWIALDGQSLRITLPVAPDEWSYVKAAFLKDAAAKAAEVWGLKPDDEGFRTFVSLVRCLAAGPVSYIDEGNRVHFVLGRRDASPTLRFDIRDEYEPSLEKVVTATVPTDCDKAAALSLLGHAKPPPAVAQVLDSNVPEAAVGALLRWAKTGDAAEKDAAAAALKTWAERWNRDHSVPATPPAVDARDDYLKAWESWYTEMRQFPLPADCVRERSP